MVTGVVDVESFCLALAVRVALFCVDCEREMRLCERETERQRGPINLPTNIRN